MPVLGVEPTPPNGSRTAFATSFSHSNEVARPGYYEVTLDNGIKVELTTTVRSGFGRFTYPASGEATMTINAGSKVNGSDACRHQHQSGHPGSQRLGHRRILLWLP